MHRHWDTISRGARLTFIDPLRSEVRPGVLKKPASHVWLAQRTINALETENKMHVYKYRLHGHLVFLNYMYINIRTKLVEEIWIVR